MPFIGCNSQREKVVAETRHMRNIEKQQRYLTSARAKGQRKISVILDRVFSTAIIAVFMEVFASR